MTAHDPPVTLTEVLAGHVRLPMMHSQGCSCGWHASLSHPDLHRAHLAERLEEHFAARLAPIRALANEWGIDLDATTGNQIHDAEEFAESISDSGAWRFVRDLRAALEATEADLSASQDHDGAEGQGEGEKAADRRCPTCGIPFAHYTHDPQGRPL